MSFRHTFVTDFIYAGNDEYKVRMPAVTAVFKEHGFLFASGSMDKNLDKNGLGFYSGFTRTSDMSLPLSDIGVEKLVWDLEKATPVPFRLTIMQESGAVITYSVNPRE